MTTYYNLDTVDSRRLNLGGCLSVDYKIDEPVYRLKIYDITNNKYLIGSILSIINTVGHISSFFHYYKPFLYEANGDKLEKVPLQLNETLKSLYTVNMRPVYETFGNQIATSIFKKIVDEIIVEGVSFSVTQCSLKVNNYAAFTLSHATSPASINHFVAITLNELLTNHTNFVTDYITNLAAIVGDLNTSDNMLLKVYTTDFDIPTGLFMTNTAIEESFIHASFLYPNLLLSDSILEDPAPPTPTP